VDLVVLFLAYKVLRRTDLGRPREGARVLPKTGLVPSCRQLYSPAAWRQVLELLGVGHWADYDQ